VQEEVFEMKWKYLLGCLKEVRRKGRDGRESFPHNEGCYSDVLPGRKICRAGGPTEMRDAVRRHSRETQPSDGEDVRDRKNLRGPDTLSSSGEPGLEATSKGGTPPEGDNVVGCPGTAAMQGRKKRPGTNARLKNYLLACA